MIKLSDKKAESDFYKSLCEASSYREFLVVYFEKTKRSYAEVARRAGFSSRSYPRDVTEGRRRLTVKALPSLTRGLSLNAPLNEIFQSLYFLEYPLEQTKSEANLSSSSIQDEKRRLKNKIKIAKSRLLRGKTRLRMSDSGPFLPPLELKNLASRYLFEVLAAAGDPDRGRTIEEIKALTGIQKQVLVPLLGFCVKEKLLRYDAHLNRYFAICAHLDLTNMPGHDLVKSVFESAVAKTSVAFRNTYQSDSALYYVSAIAVSKDKLPKIKTELRNLLLKYADSKAESALCTEPDTVIYLLGSMFEATHGNSGST